VTVYERRIKRLIDFIVASIGLVALTPILILAAVTIIIEDGLPAVFRQRRVGRNGKLFTLYKFRSMPKGTPHVASAAAGELRITRVGKIIRRTNIDELPQLLNVIKGDMSLIGPRPALPSQETLQMGRTTHGIDRVRPGLTGLAQVNSYDGMPESEKLKWERQYVHCICFRSDFLILLRTFAYLIRRPPAY
jgi:lipopolysaccharide/colanic/teichoic acid biosynthesis glycosyltransferase